MPIEVFYGGHVACQEQYNIIPMGQNFHSNAKHFYCSCHICNMAAMQNLYYSVVAKKLGCQLQIKLRRLKESAKCMLCFTK